MSKTRPKHDAESRDLLRIRRAVEAAGDVALEWDLVTDSVTWSGFGPFGAFVSQAQLSTGAEFLRRILPEDLIARRRAMADHIGQGAIFDCDYRMYGLNQERIWVNERGTVERDAAGRPSRLLATLRVVTHRKEREERLRYEAQHDLLTGLYNRLRLAEALDSITAYNARYGLSGAYFAVGVDRLSIINDAFGHETGDAVLMEFAERLETMPPLGDVIGRVSGDCFGVVAASCPETEVDAIADRLLERLRSTPIETPSGPIFVTASVGAVEVLGATRSSHDLMARADVALREAKRAGRNCSVRYTSTDILRKGQKEDIAIAERVQAALKSDQLLFAYQPIVSSESSAVAHYECLLRMMDEHGGVVAAATFMPVIEEMGLIRQIDLRVLDLAAEDLRHNRHVMLAINVSGLTACGQGQAWIEKLRAHVEADPGIASRLMIEITETVALRDIEETARFVKAVRSLGCKVALDDFGAGYTSFRNLRTLDVDVIKIDGSFVRDLPHNRDNQIFIQSLVGLARGFNLHTVAEFVETAAEASILADEGVDFMQGYFFGKPSTDRPWMPATATAPRMRVPTTH